MSLINKEKFLNGVGKAVDATNNMADKASTFVKEKEIDKKAVKAAKTAEKGIKFAGNKLGEIAGEVVAGYKSKTEGKSSASTDTCENASADTTDATSEVGSDTAITDGTTGNCTESTTESVTDSATDDIIVETEDITEHSGDEA